MWPGNGLADAIGLVVVDDLPHWKEGILLHGEWAGAYGFGRPVQ
jgi:hypothetical protein